MIKVYNKKSLKEIEELREKGLYNAPFAVQEAANNVKIETPDTKDLEDKIKDLEDELARSNETMVEYVEKVKEQAKIIDELNGDLDALVGGSDE